MFVYNDFGLLQGPRKIKEHARQVGCCQHLVYTGPDLRQRLVASFAVLLIKQRYVPHVEFVREEASSTGVWEVVDTSDESGAFLCDYDDYNRARRDMEEEFNRWQGFVFCDDPWHTLYANEENNHA